MKLGRTGYVLAVWELERQGDLQGLFESSGLNNESCLCSLQSRTVHSPSQRTLHPLSTSHSDRRGPCQMHPSIH